MKTIAIMNNKGGVGKTVTAINLADILVREYGRRVVLVDCDGQCNLTRFFIPEFDPETEITLFDLLTMDAESVWEDNLTYLDKGLDLLPASSDLYELDYQCIQKGVGDTGALCDFADAAREDGAVDYMIFDCPPGFTVGSVAALTAADEVVIPMLVDGFGFAGVQDMRKQIASLRAAQQDVRIAGVLITQWHNSEVVKQGEALLRSMDVPVFAQTIRRTDKVPESTFDRQPILRYSPTSAAARDYRAWVREYIGEVERNGV